MNEVGVQINGDWRMLLHTFRKVEEALRKSYVRPTLRSRCTYLFANLHHRDIILFLLFICEQLLKAMQISFRFLL